MSGAIYLPSGKIMVMGKIMFYVGCMAVGLQLQFLWGCAKMPGGAGTGDQARMTSVSFNVFVGMCENAGWGRYRGSGKNDICKF